MQLNNQANTTNVYYIFDGTFDGLLTCVFDAFERKEIPKGVRQDESNELFAENYHVITSTEKTERVLNGLQKKISKSAFNMLFTCWLSELTEVEIHLFNYIYKSFIHTKSIELNFADTDVLELSKIYKKVTREAEKMRQFVRFQKTKDGTFFAAIEPMYNVLPMVVDFFQDRFADQVWIIYDIKREYALYYDLTKTETVYFENIKINKLTGKLDEDIMAEDELYFQSGWKQYIRSISIKERKNLKLQRQHMPKRFWRYLTEKQ